MTRSQPLPPLKLTFGTDPEFFLSDAEADGQIISSLRVVQEDKYNPLDLGAGVKMYSDNVLIEASLPPIPSDGDVAAHLRDVFGRMQKRLGKRYRLLPQASYEFPDSELTDERSRQIGCSVSYNAWAREANRLDAFPGNTRSGSAHVHVGRADWENPPAGDERLLSMASKEVAVKLMDVFAGCAGVIVTRDKTATARKRLYGLASEFRPSGFGFEYRVLDNYMLRTPQLAQLTWDITAHAMSHISAGTGELVLKTLDPAQIQKAINQWDRKLARRVLEKAPMPAALMARVEQEYETPSFQEAWGIG